MMKKILEKVKEKGIRRSIRMVSVKLKKAECFECGRVGSKKREAIGKVMGSEFDRVIIFENHFGYFNIMLQRPQHMTRELSDRHTLVLYNSYYDIDYKNSTRINNLYHNFYILDMYYYRSYIMEKLKESKAGKYVMVYSTDTVPMSRIREYQKAGFEVVYEYVDDINADLIAHKKLQDIRLRHQELINDKETLTIATATKLYDDVVGENGGARVKLISNGVEMRRFSPLARTLDAQYLRWIDRDKIKVGYYGAMASWIDYRLLRDIASDQRFQIILIGVEHDDSLRLSGILEYENVRYFGRKPYDQLSGYAHFFDVCMIPFLLNNITEATSPVKLFEYMAMEKPVVTTNLPECSKYDAVKVAEDRTGFVELLYSAYLAKDNAGYREKLRQCALENDWSAKAGELRSYLDQGEALNER